MAHPPTAPSFTGLIGGYEALLQQEASRKALLRAGVSNTEWVSDEPSTGDCYYPIYGSNFTCSAKSSSWRRFCPCQPMREVFAGDVSVSPYAGNSMHVHKTNDEGMVTSSF